MTAATASSSQPRAVGGCGATSRSATSSEAMNSTRVWAARDLRLSDAASASPLTESATNSRPVRAPAAAATASPKPSHAAVVYPHQATSQIFGRADQPIQSATCARTQQ